MDEQGSTIDVAFGQSSSEGSETRCGEPLHAASGSTSDAIAEGKEPSMNQYESSEEAPAASLVGSLAVVLSVRHPLDAGHHQADR